MSPIERNYANARVCIFPSMEQLGAAAARQAGEVIRRAVTVRGQARIVVATGNSQLALVSAMATLRDVAWRHVEVFHMDEYVGLAATHPASFRHWIRTRIEEPLSPRQVHYLNGDAPDVDAELARYTQLLLAAPIDLALVGFGENGHIAFNDPHVADFADPLTVRRVVLDETSRRQQVGEGHFPSLDDVPREALTMTWSGLLRAAPWICSVPERRKATAVCAALQGPITTACPASIVRTHRDATVYLDADSAALLLA
jgi:glucosamine-6-phosphate deaminase